MAKTFYRSFAGGEITPELRGRLELSKFQTGLRTCLNFVTLPHGPAARRPGTVYALEGRDSSKAVWLVPFVFAADQAVMMEFGEFYVRFHTSAGTVLETGVPITSITQASPGLFTRIAHGFATGDWLYLSGVGGMTSLNGRFYKAVVVSPNTYTLTDLAGNAISTTALPAYTGGGTASRVYTLASPYAAADLSALHITQDSDVLTITRQGYRARELRRSGATSWAFSLVDFTPTLVAPTGVTATATVAVATNLTTQTYVVTRVAADLVTESVASSTASCSNNLTLAGNFNTITFSAPGSGERTFVYKKRGGVFGYIGQTTGTSLVDDNILPDTTLTPPETIITLNTGLNDAPQTAVHHERRRWFAGTPDKPQTVWATRSNTLANLQSSIPSRDDDGMEFRIAASQQNAIRHLVSFVDLVALTVGGIFRLFADGGPALSPSTISIKPQGASGASNVQPVITESSVLYVQARGSRVRELGFDSSGSGRFTTVDASIMAPHLFNGKTIVQLAYTQAPESVLWAVRNDGVLLSLSYVPDQQVYGWHQHSTDGFVESAAVIPEGNEDVLYLVVRRTMNGRTVRLIERLAPRLFLTLPDAYFVDCGLTYRGAPATVISGLWHLEGRAVQVLADGAVVSGKTVASGQITLDEAASVVHIGLAYTSDLVTLPQAYEGAPAAGQGMSKNVKDVYLLVTQSSLVKAGPDFDSLTEYPARAVSDPYGSPPALRNGELVMAVDPEWSSDGVVCVRQDQPLPLTVVAIALDTATGGG